MLSHQYTCFLCCSTRPRAGQAIGHSHGGTTFLYIMISGNYKYRYLKACVLASYISPTSQSVLALLLPGCSLSPSTGISVVSLCSWLARKAPCQPCRTALLTISLSSSSGSVPFLSCRSIISLVCDIRSSDNCDVICSA